MEKYDNSENTWMRWSAESAEEAELIIMGIPFDNATSVGKGTSQGPETIRRLSKDLSDVSENFIPIKEGILFDAGDIPMDLNWERFFGDIEKKAYEIMGTGKFPLFIGGDHSVTIPLHRAFGKFQKEKNENARIGVIHFDAHYDLCDEWDGSKWSHACTEARTLEDVISDDDLHFLGIRCAELSELDTLAKYPGISTITAADVYENGVKWAYAKLEDHFIDYDAVYFTLDIDVLDPGFAPGTGTPVAGGISNRELMELTKLIIANLPVKAMDIVEVSPPLDVNNITTWSALKIIHVLLEHFSTRE